MTTAPNTLMDLQATGDNPGTWGVITNTNLSIIDNRMGGRLAQAAASSNITLSDSQAENVLQRITGTLGANIDLIFPASSGGFYLIKNETTGSFTITAKPSGGTGVTVPQNAMTLVFINPSQTTAYKISSLDPTVANTFTALQTFSAGITGTGSIGTLTINNDNWSGTDLSVANGGTGASTLTGLLQGNGTGAITGGATINNDNWSGTDLSVANGGTGASTLTGLLQGNGTGAITGSATINNSNWSGTDLAVVNGGTGASDAGTARTNLGLGTAAVINVPVTVGNGGTAATDAATAARNLLNGLGTTKGNIVWYNGSTWTVLAPP